MINCTNLQLGETLTIEFDNQVASMIGSESSPVYCAGPLKNGAYCARHACTRTVIKMLDRTWLLGLQHDKQSRTNVRRDHMLYVLNRLANGGHGVHATVKEAEKAGEFPSIKWD